MIWSIGFLCLVLFVAVLMAVDVLRTPDELKPRAGIPRTGEAATTKREDWLARIYAQRITALAVLIAGRRRPSVREEWHAHLAGDNGQVVSPPERFRAASGFAIAAVRYRLRDASRLAWRLTDAVLKSRPLSNTFVLIPAAVAAVVILNHDGAVVMLKSADGIAAIGGALYGLVRVGRWYRNVKPPEPKARRAKG
jgi:hypothetical protein